MLDGLYQLKKKGYLMVKFLVTAGAGFIGSAVIRHLVNDMNHSVVDVDKLTWRSR